METGGERERERESFIRNNLHNGVVSGAARGCLLLCVVEGWHARYSAEQRSALAIQIADVRSKGE